MNRLAHESSPYLRQHAENPVDWYPWGEEAFARARAEDRPIFLSVGYSTCHWCHVMAHESFEDPDIAALLNEAFVCIKVDREERPDIDSVYMAFTQALTGEGGWPMTVFLTPDLEPFYAGTYFPPDDQWGNPGLPRLIDSIREAWLADRSRVLESAATITARMREASARVALRGGTIAPEAPARVVAALRGVYDAGWGGFGGAPKFPNATLLEFLLMHHARAGRSGGEATAPAALEMVTHTLRRMAAGGIYDHLGGGFHRYSVDGHWVVPHFEKMLYDNAMLARLYLHAWQATGDPLFARVARETLDYLLREMLDDGGGFYTAQDADSEEIEGRFFAWTVDEIDAALGPADGALCRAVFAVTDFGNFEDPHHPEFLGANVFTRPRPLAEIAAEQGLNPAALERRVDELLARLFAAREQRVHPGRDDKVLTSWNGLALSACAEAARILDEPRYREAAVRNAAFVRERLWDGARLRHVYRDGVATVDGLLEDYAAYGLGLVDLYRATGDLSLLAWAGELLAAAVERFHDDEAGGFFEAPLDRAGLILRQKPLVDTPTPSGNGAIALLAAWLGRYTGRADWEALAGEVIALATGQFERSATGFGTVLQALELVLAPPREIAIVGTPEARAPFERELARHFLPAALIAPAGNGGGLPVLAGRDVPAGAAAAYVCERTVCDLPARTVEAFREQLAGLA
ncbi:MAG: thioredoxin domain-containing protein [Dehalococcoidia bacterium]|nr:thioredoxin domain-containing protein [Dehalococcoidia bacterium]